MLREYDKASSSCSGKKLPSTEANVMGLSLAFLLPIFIRFALVPRSPTQRSLFYPGLSQLFTGRSLDTTVLN